MRDFLINSSRYPRLLFSVMVGVILFALAPLVPLLKNPLTAVAVIGFFVAGIAFFTFTLRAMLGI
ncbi:MAG: DUF751 family protein [Myxacorys californica WJT36-NPBG1]|nr:DUF751 family protein [Myxacorys californica WJT36-NPBG1]